ncbi:MAG: ECF transporter S component [Blautia sp.]|nr:ECF transporter S component [Blautia sp.]MCM1199705.1 ECF transporter S component [Bacteroides fragilis]
MSGLLQSIQENVIFLLQFLAVVIGLFLAAYAAEKYAAKRAKMTGRILSTRKIAMIGMFSAIAAVLMLFEIPMPFAPGFYKLDFSELPALIAAFAFGPVAGVMVEFCKIVLKLLFKSTSTAFVGELANFAVGCSFLLPASMIYLFNKTKKTAIISCIAGTLCMTVFGTAFNAVYLLPEFALLYGLPMEALIGMGTAVNGAITGITSFVCFAVAPLNLIKGASVSIITLLVYKQLSPILKEAAPRKQVVF